MDAGGRARVPRMGCDDEGWGSPIRWDGGTPSDDSGTEGGWSHLVRGIRARGRGRKGG